MNNPETPFASPDGRFEAVLGTVLQVGVVMSAAIVGCGGLRYLTGHALLTPVLQHFRGEPAELRSIGGIVSAAKTLSGPGLIQLGVLLLIATPIARVVFSVIGFARQRDWLYVGVTLVVLTLLTYSLTAG